MRKYPKPIPVSEYMKFDKDLTPPDSWKQIIKRISFNPPYEWFYRNYPVKPGFYFYQALIEAKIPLKFLTGINIPDFFINLPADS